LNNDRLRWWIGFALILMGLVLAATIAARYFNAATILPDNSAAALSTDATVPPSPPATTPIPTPASTSAPSLDTTAAPGLKPRVLTDTNVEDEPSPKPKSALALQFEGELAYEHVLTQVAIGPRPTGSEAGWATGDFIIEELEKLGWQAESQEFFFKGVRGRNIIGRRDGSRGPVIIVGAHYDTRPAADQDPAEALRTQWIDGANDGASGVAVLLELARVLETEKVQNEVWLAFFDAEDRGRLEGWPFSVGARHLAENLAVNPQSVVVVDMVGDADQQLYFERNSTEELAVDIWNTAAELGYSAYFIPEPKHTIIDDHLPFLERLIPAVDIIDFDYPYWHTVEDTADKVAPESLERVGRTLEVWLEEKQ
jgi:hypothetical protein